MYGRDLPEPDDPHQAGTCTSPALDQGRQHHREFVGFDTRDAQGRGRQPVEPRGDLAHGVVAGFDAEQVGHFLLAFQRDQQEDDLFAPQDTAP